jgi:Ser-tRNA(Ala) deacylase AlaX
MKTHLTYFEDTYKFEDQATILSVNKDETGHFLLLNQTIFHPQGGGQPSDQGTLQVGSDTIPIHRVKSVDNTIRHYTDKSYSPLVGQEVKCFLNQDMRLTHAQLHTAGHLISNIIEKLTPHWNGVKGHHFPNECYVEFTSQNGKSDALSLEQITEEIKKYVAMDCSLSRDQVTGDKIKELCPNLKFNILHDQPVRIVRIGDFPFSPCGGTHVKSLGEIKGLEITRIKMKNKIMKINYCIQ